MKSETSYGVSNALAWIALIIAIIALILGWTAFNRTGANLETLIEERVEEAVNEIEETANEAAQEVDENVDLDIGEDAEVGE